MECAAVLPVSRHYLPSFSNSSPRELGYFLHSPGAPAGAMRLTQRQYRSSGDLPSVTGVVGFRAASPCRADARSHGLSPTALGVWLRRVRREVCYPPGPLKNDQAIHTVSVRLHTIAFQETLGTTRYPKQ